MKKKHEGQLRKHGEPYYTHPESVSLILKEKGFPIDYQVAGLFHDLIEDTDATYEELLELSNEDVVEAVRLVTKEKGYKMSEYVQRIRNNEMAKMLKLADRMHNLSQTHLASDSFRIKYIKETKKWYLDLAKGTVFERDILELINRLDNID